jgi:transcription initiation factor TFIIB
MPYHNRCTDCGSQNMIEDWRCGDYVCGDCGLVAQGGIIDESPEWINNAEDGIDRSRVGAPNSTLFTDALMSTTIGKNSKMWLMVKIHEQSSMSYKDRSLLRVYQDIQKVGEDTMHLPGTVLDSAKELYKDIKEAKITRGENHKALVAACVYYACKSNQCKREKYEVSDAFAVDRSAFTQACKTFLDLVRDKPYYEKLFEAKSSERGIIYRTLSALPIADDRTVWKFVSRVETAYDRVRTRGDGLLDSKTPHSIICALAFLCAKEVDLQFHRNQIKDCCKVSSVTLNKTIALVEEIYNSTSK